MRTTITLDPDIAAAVEQRRRAEGVGVSEIVNDLARRGLGTRSEHRPFVQRTADLGAMVDVRNVWEVIEQLEGPSYR